MVAIKELKVCASDVDIESVQAKYKYTDGSTAWTEVHGETCSNEHHIILKPGEKISAVFGYAPGTVRMLTFITSTSPESIAGEPCRRVFGPFGSAAVADKELFTVHADVVSLFGKSGNRLHSIGFFTR